MRTIYFSILSFFCLVIFTGCASAKRASSPNTAITNFKSTIDDSKFETIIDGKETHLYHLQNKNGLQMSITNYGQRIVSLVVPDKNGQMDDIVLGFNTIEEYKNPKAKYIGAVIGRSANRIANGKFNLNQKPYTLALNNGSNHSHGGHNGFNNQVWLARQTATNQIEFSRISADGEEGYPGNLSIKTKYTLTNNNELKIEYTATTDQETIVNLTNHSFFNLNGEGNGTVNNHILTIFAQNYTPLNQNLIPTGAIESVANTPFDFRVPKEIGKDLKTPNLQLDYTNGYDQNYVLNAKPINAKELTLAASISHPINGRMMEVYTNEPGLQFYESNFFDGSLIGKSGKPYLFRGAFCLETQRFPDAPNQPQFPSTILKPGQIYNSICIYKFGIYAEK